MKTQATRVTANAKHLLFDLNQGDTMRAAGTDVAVGASTHRFRIGMLPANAIVTGTRVVVTTASNDSSAHAVRVGTFDIESAFSAAADLKTTGVVIGAGAGLNVKRPTATPVYITNVGSAGDATLGNATVIVEYIDTVQGCENAIYGMDTDRIDAVPA